MNLISIICGAYNVEDTLSKSIESIINQSFKNWQLIICEDGSKDNTLNILTGYKELLGDKLIILKNEKNMGLNYSLNKCILESTGKYIARHDLDDISHENRLAKQVLFLENNPEYALVGSGMFRE